MTKSELQPPKAERIRHIHKDSNRSSRPDFYHWMRLSDTEKTGANPTPRTRKVITHLEAENNYTSKYLSHTEELQKCIYDEIVGRIAPDDASVPYKSNGYIYRVRYVEGSEYPIYQRKLSTDEDYETILDVNNEAKTKSYCQIQGLRVSPNNELLAYAEDLKGRRQYQIKVVDIQSGKLVRIIEKDTTGQVVWASDSATIYYVTKDEALRPCTVIRHRLKDDDGHVIYHENDERFRVYIGKTKSKAFILIGAASSLTTEYRYLAAGDTAGDPQVFAPRKDGEEYHPSHHEGYWYIRTNQDAQNFRIMKCNVNSTKRLHWVPFIPHNTDMYLHSMDVTKHFLILSVRCNGQTEMYYKKWTASEGKLLRLDEEAYTVYPGTNADYNSVMYRVIYTSMTTPRTTIDIDLSNGVKSILKEQRVVGTFDKADYITERLMATAHDGAQIPVSIVYHRSFADTEHRPLLLYAYGSYGYSMDPYFSSARLSLLDRGVSFAIAHVRGGSEYGRQWYEEGKFLKKKNTFYDFISCAEHLIKKGKVDPSKLFAMGGSAGGLLMGAVMNQRPDLWKGIVAAVPFVDVVSTMLDASIPLTVGEYEEWGNPNDPEYYHYMLEYSPYDNVSAQDYPATLVTSGYHDSQVQYWEPTKWVSKIRHHSTGSNPILLHTNMEAGHSGSTGRYRIHKETALEYAFIIDQADLL